MSEPRPPIDAHDARPAPSASSSASSAELADAVARRQLVRSTPRFTGRVLSVRTDVVDLGDGQRVERDIVMHPGAVGIVAVDDELRVLLIRQYRHPVGALLWEPPAGLLDVEGEQPLEAAARELFEESGYQARTWSVLVDVFTSPGGSDEAARIYLARDLTEVLDRVKYVGDGEERDMPIRWVPLAQARDAVLAGRLHNPLGVMGILAATALLLGPVPGGTSARRPDAPWLRSRAATHDSMPS
jgi:8-oxo-dGDP phosphatase